MLRTYGVVHNVVGHLISISHLLVPRRQVCHVLFFFANVFYLLQVLHDVGLVLSHVKFCMLSFGGVVIVLRLTSSFLIYIWVNYAYLLGWNAVLDVVHQHAGLILCITMLVLDVLAIALLLAGHVG